MPQHRSCLCCTIAASHQSNTRSIIKSTSSSIRVLGARRPSRNKETRHLGARRPTQARSTLLTLALGGTSAIQAHRGSAAWEHVGNPSTEMMMKTEFASNDEPRCSQEQSSPTIIIMFPTTNIAPKREGRVGQKEDRARSKPKSDGHHYHNHRHHLLSKTCPVHSPPAASPWQPNGYQVSLQEGRQ